MRCSKTLVYFCARVTIRMGGAIQNAHRETARTGRNGDKYVYVAQSTQRIHEIRAFSGRRWIFTQMNKLVSASVQINLIGGNASSILLFIAFTIRAHLCVFDVLYRLFYCQWCSTAALPLIQLIFISRNCSENRFARGSRARIHFIRTRIGMVANSINKLLLIKYFYIFILAFRSNEINDTNHRIMKLFELIRVITN